VNINYKDLLERTGWTAIQAGAASMIVFGFDLDSLKVAGAAAGVAALKVLVAQNIGDRGSGDAIPGGVK
jgi:hypothetical protein